MSPKIGVGLDIAGVAPRSDRPADKIRAALQLVRAQGFRLALGEDGVGRDVRTGGWVADSPYRPRRVGLAGAICLALQPLEGRQADEGAAAALDVSWDWLLGVLDGWDGEAQTTLLEAASRALYLDGIRTGHVLFAECSRECDRCGARFLGEHCASCR